MIVSDAAFVSDRRRRFRGPCEAGAGVALLVEYMHALSLPRLAHSVQGELPSHFSFRRLHSSQACGQRAREAIGEQTKASDEKVAMSAERKREICTKLTRCGSQVSTFSNKDGPCSSPFCGSRRTIQDSGTMYFAPSSSQQLDRARIAAKISSPPKVVRSSASAALLLDLAAVAIANPHDARVSFFLGS